MASLRAPVCFALLLAACPGSSDDTGGSASSETSATTATTSTTAATSEGSSGSTSPTTSTQTSSSSSGPAESGSADSSSSAGGDACDPHGGDDGCEACTRESCCGQLHGCVDDPDCATVYACLGGINQPSVEEQMICANDEGIEFETVSAFLQQIYQCRMALCSADCPA